VSEVLLQLALIRYPPTASQLERHHRIQKAAREFEKVIKDTCPESFERTWACHKILDTVRCAKIAIACNETEETSHI
jgi:hypothetical protein